MSCKLFALLASLTFFNLFCLCVAETCKTKLDDPKPSVRRTGFKGPFFGKRSTDQADNVGDYYDYYHEPEEPQCSEDQFWHVRGLRCVPFECPGGNQFRDQHTGECILKSYGVSKGDMRGRQGRLLNSRMKSPTKFRLPFGLTLKG